MDINFDSIKADVAGFEKVWKQARKDNNTSKMSAVLNAFANSTKKTADELRRMTDLMSIVAVSDINDEIKK